MARRMRHCRTFASCRYENGEMKSKYQAARIGSLRGKQQDRQKSNKTTTKARRKSDEENFAKQAISQQSRHRHRRLCKAHARYRRRTEPRRVRAATGTDSFVALLRVL